MIKHMQLIDWPDRFLDVKSPKTYIVQKCNDIATDSLWCHNVLRMQLQARSFCVTQLL